MDKWSGSIEIGVTTHNPNNLDYPATMTNLRSGDNTHKDVVEPIGYKYYTVVDALLPVFFILHFFLIVQVQSWWVAVGYWQTGREPAGNTVNSAWMNFRYRHTSTLCSFCWERVFLCLTSPIVFQEGDHIGLMRKASGALHFYINGIDQGETFHYKRKVWQE